MQLKGYIPVIAHPERNREIRENPFLLYHLVEKGAASQITSGSLAGTFGKQLKAFSLRLVEANLIHFVASDAHNVKNEKFSHSRGPLCSRERIRLGTSLYADGKCRASLAESDHLQTASATGQKKKNCLVFFNSRFSFHHFLFESDIIVYCMVESHFRNLYRLYPTGYAGDHSHS